MIILNIIVIALSLNNNNVRFKIGRLIKYHLYVNHIVYVLSKYYIISVLNFIILYLLDSRIYILDREETGS